MTACIVDDYVIVILSFPLHGTFLICAFTQRSARKMSWTLSAMIQIMIVALLWN